jgi:molybdopterin/thiamine biosynthesis adenylyltransferase
MMDALVHETLYRGAEVIEKLGGTKLVVCGAGALGANIAESMVRAGARSLTVIDRDRIEERNLSTQPYRRTDVGGFKAKTLANDLFRATGAKIAAEPVELVEKNARDLLAGAELVIDTFDNSVARGLVKKTCAEADLAGLHAGMASDYAEVIWTELYRVPSPTNDDVCDYPLARNLVTLTTSVACEVVLRWVATGARESYTVTLGDFGISRYP